MNAAKAKQRALEAAHQEVQRARRETAEYWEKMWQQERNWATFWFVMTLSMFACWMFTLWRIC